MAGTYALLTYYVLPIIVGMSVGRRLSRPLNFGLMVAVWYVGSAILVAFTRDQYRPLDVLPALFLFPGGLIPVLTFVLIALKTSPSASRKTTRRT
jgi:hypothetical protein